MLESRDLRHFSVELHLYNVRNVTANLYFEPARRTQLNAVTNLNKILMLYFNHRGRILRVLQHFNVRRSKTEIYVEFDLQSEMASSHRSIFRMISLKITFGFLLLFAVLYVVICISLAKCSYTIRDTGYKNSSYVIRDNRYGRIRGFQSQRSQIFLGIPYANPPRRWHAPTPPKPWETVLEATHPAPMCYQGENCTKFNPVGTCLPDMSEDCLYLNIYAPLDTTPQSRKAVMLFFHGGGFEFSSGGAEIYNGEMLSSKGDVILVTINYRLGVFGFLVTGNGSDDASGNYGILDQVQALRWVHENIAYFGGDNTKITLFGQSAGAISAAILSASDKIAHLFHRLILESIPFSIPLKPLDVAIQQGKEFASLLGCTNQITACLRSKTAVELAKAQGLYSQRVTFSDSYLRKFIPWIPHTDGELIKNNLLDSLQTGTFYHKPIIIGTTSEEGQIYVYSGFREPVSTQYYRILLTGLRPSQSTFNMYRPVNQTDARPNLAELTTDFVFFCPSRVFARKISRCAPVYLYIFNDQISIPGIWNNVVQCEGKVCHGSEVPYVFQTARRKPFVFSDKEFKLSDAIIYYWTNFAKTGNPNSVRQLRFPVWPPYLPDGDLPEVSMMLRERDYGAYQGYRQTFCDFWDSGKYRA